MQEEVVEMFERMISLIKRIEAGEEGLLKELTKVRKDMETFLRMYC
jgi:hypothetical protein